MDPVTIAALITAGVTLIGSIITNFSNRRNVSNTNATNLQSVQETNQANSLLAQQQHTWNVQDWQMQSDWESPSHQMQMFRDAGLNPNLIYGQMSDSPSINSTSPNPMQANKAMPFLAENPMQGLDPLMLARLDNIKANTEKTRAEAETENELRDSRKRNLDMATSNLAKQNEEILSRIQRFAKENELTDAQIFDISFNQMIKQGQFQLDVQRLENETNLSQAQVKKLIADRDLALAQVKVTNREFDEMVWTYAIRKSGLANQVNLSKSQRDQAAATARKLGIESQMEEPQAIVRSQAAKELQNGNLFTWAAYGFYDVISNMGRIIH